MLFSRRNKRFSVSLGMITLLVCAFSVEAEIYKYRDSQGRIHFTDKPMAGKYRLVWRSGLEKGSARNGYSTAEFRKNKMQLTPLIDATARRARLHPGLLHAIVLAESAYNPQARSHKGALGLMQLMPATASRYGVDNSLDPLQNLEGGTSYLKDLLIEFKYDLKLAIAAYNAGENAVRKYGNVIPPYPETQQYVDKVMGYYRDNLAAMP
jgi:soluble lytic murein transglycosylase-like protein